jgi:hypothetical protein
LGLLLPEATTPASHHLSWILHRQEWLRAPLKVILSATQMLLVL